MLSCPSPGCITDGVVSHVVVGVVPHHMSLRHHPHQRLFVGRHHSGVVAVKVVGVDEEGSSYTRLKWKVRICWIITNKSPP